MMVALLWAEIVEPIPENLFREPLEFIRADHYRQRQVCAVLDDIARHAAPESEREAARLALDYLERQLPLHIADEEQDLFDRLRACCLPEDGIEDMLHMLHGEHAREDRLAQELLPALRRVAEGIPPQDTGAFRRIAATFSETQRRHIAWENDFLLPLARRRLRPADIAEFGRAMAVRRGAEYPE
jgi:hemerythrin-like domain-containing protein